MEKGEMFCKCCHLVAFCIGLAYFTDITGSLNIKEIVVMITILSIDRVIN